MCIRDRSTRAREGRGLPRFQDVHLDFLAEEAAEQLLEALLHAEEERKVPPRLPAARLHEPAVHRGGLRPRNARDEDGAEDG
eukprot:863015-Alexandrium_andersonii.AAC.1